MSKARSEEFVEEGILSVVFDRELGLCGWFGDERIDNALYGFGPRQDFLRALEKEMKFHMRNMGGLSEHPILRRVFARFQQGLKKRGEGYDEFPVNEHEKTRAR